jgi:hypothetical protein
LGLLLWPSDWDLQTSLWRKGDVRSQDFELEGIIGIKMAYYKSVGMLSQPVLPRSTLLLMIYL